MASLLLPIIYLTFISLGLPDSLLGTAWPVMHVDLGAPVAAQSLISIIISCCTIVSSLFTARLTNRLGTGRLTALSVALTAAAILGFTTTNAFWQLCLIAIPYGLGAGAIDAALNNYVALNYGARHMSWLHCCWGIGASAGPLVMGWALGNSLGWPGGYLVIGATQVVITMVLTFAIPLWNRAAQAGGPGGEREQAVEADAPTAATATPPTNRELLRLPGARAAIASFGTYCALEGSIGLWIASYLTLARGFDASAAAAVVGQFYIGITVGRLVSGFIAQWLTSENQIRLGQALVASGLIGLVTLDGPIACGTCVLVAGLGCAPIYPSIVALTPKRFGERASQGLVSLQMACAYAGSMLVPPIFGLVAGAGGAALVPLLAIALLVANVLLAERAVRATGH